MMGAHPLLLTCPPNSWQSQMSKAAKQWQNPAPTVDVIVEVEPGVIVLIRRKNPPYGWALPGGFVDEGESVERAAVREAKEELSLDVSLKELFYVYSDPLRDPRKHTMSTVFWATPLDPGQTPRAQDDASELGRFDLDALPSPLCFDHAEILQDFKTWRASGKRPDPQEKLKR